MIRVQRDFTLLSKRHLSGRGPGIVRTTGRAASGSIAVLVALLLSTANPAAAQTNPSIVVPLTDPALPVTLDVALISGSISVRPHDAPEVVIAVSTQSDGEDDAAEPTESEGSLAAAARGPRSGLRRLPNVSIGLTAEERDNAVSVAVDPMRRPVELEISVPRRTSVKARTVNGGDLRIEGVSGEHELTNVNGSVFAVDVAGSAVVATTNGDIEVSFTEITPGEPMSFTSFNGDVVVGFPPGLAANLRIDSGRGEVLTNLDIEVQAQPPVIEDSNQGGRRRVRLERELHGVVGGGGPEIAFRTFNGDIEIRGAE